MMNQEEPITAQDAKYYVGVAFAGSSKSYYFSTDDETIKIGDLVIVNSLGGYEMAEVVTGLRSTKTYKSSLQLKPIVRKPNSNDLADYTKNLKDAEYAMEITRREVARLGLNMNLVDANYTLDRDKITINYTADARVDFRELLRVLASQLRCRIELHQIASRDKAKMVGGIGICGLPLCCSTFLNAFDGISISRAKNQMLTLNIPKLSGHCGKLICCLLYEDDLYVEARKMFPNIGTPVHLNEGDYTVTGYNILSKSVKLVSSENTKFITLDEYNDAVNHVKKPKPSTQNENAPREAGREERRHPQENRQMNQGHRDGENRNNNFRHRHNNHGRNGNGGNNGNRS